MNVPAIDTKLFAVMCIKLDGRRTEFNRYDTRAVCDEIVQHLARIGCRAEVLELAGRSGGSVGADTSGRPREPGAVTDERA